MEIDEKFAKIKLEFERNLINSKQKDLEIEKY